MRRTLLLVLAAFTGPALAQGVGPKPGLWEVKTVRQTLDGRDANAQMAAARSQMQQKAMARMTPEQRAQMEAMMSSKGASADTAGASHRVCVSAAMAARNKPMVDPQGRCEPNKVTRSGGKTSFEFDCTANGMGAAGKGESVEAGDTITTVVDTTMTEPRGRHTMHTETQMKYLGQDCQGLKPLDQLGKEVPRQK
jgi:hypothetical protein